MGAWPLRSDLRLVVLAITIASAGCITDTIEGAEIYVTNHSSLPRVLAISSKQERSGTSTTIWVSLPADGTERVSPVVPMSPTPGGTARVDVYDLECRLITVLEVDGLGRYRMDVTSRGAAIEPYADAPASVAGLPISTVTCAR